MLVTANRLVERREADDGYDCYDASTASDGLVSISFAREATPWLRLLRCPTCGEYQRASRRSASTR